MVQMKKLQQKNLLQKLVEKNYTQKFCLQTKLVIIFISHLPVFFQRETSHHRVVDQQLYTTPLEYYYSTFV